MEENYIAQNRIKTYTAATVMVRSLLYMLAGFFFNRAFSFVEISSDTVELFNACSSLVYALLAASVYFIMGYLLTRDKRKMLIFAGSMYFGKSLVSVISSLVSAIATSLAQATTINSDTYSNINLVSGFVLLIPEIIVAYIIYTTLEGMGKRAEGGIDASRLTLSSARKRYLVYFLIVTVIGISSGSVPSLITAFLQVEGKSFAVIFQLFNWLSGVLDLVVLIFISYSAYKSVTDMFAFGAGLGAARGLANIAFGVINIPFRLVVNHVTETMQNGLISETGLILTAATSVYGIITTVISVVAALVMLKYFFSNNKPILFESIYTSEKAAFAQADEEKPEEESAKMAEETDYSEKYK